jgi:hypothetical protein
VPLAGATTFLLNAILGYVRDTPEVFLLVEVGSPALNLCSVAMACTTHACQLIPRVFVLVILVDRLERLALAAMFLLDAILHHMLDALGTHVP